MIEKWGQGHTFDSVRKDIENQRWDSAGSSGVLSGVLGVTRPYDNQKPELRTYQVAPLLEYQGMSERLLCMNACSMNFCFLPGYYPLKRGRGHFIGGSQVPV